MFKKPAVLFVVIIVLFLSSCAPSSPKLSILTDTPAPSPSVQPSALPSILSSLASTIIAIEPQDTEEPMPGTTTDDPSDWIGDMDSWDESSLPSLFPDDADDKVFDTDKVLDYLAGDPANYTLSISNSELSNGRLYITISADWYLDNADDGYQYLKDTYSLPDKDILNLPIFSGCVIHGGHMFAGKSNWEDSKSYKSYNDWLNADDYPNFLTLGETVLPPVPVSENARVSLLVGNSLEYTDMTYEQFKEYALSSYISGLEDISVNYSGGEITAIYQDDGDV